MRIYRQGDVLLVEVNAPAGTQTEGQGAIILAHGELTGHAHRISQPGGKARMWDAGAERFLQVMETVALTHEEHATVTIPPGSYRVVIQTEYTPRELRRVQD